MIDARKEMKVKLEDAIRIAQRLHLYKADFQMYVQTIWHDVRNEREE